MEINQPSSSSNGGLPLGNGQKPGERLRQVRLSQKRDLADVSSELNIPQRILVLLEADEYAELPQAAFVRGQLRSYAKLLGVDGDALVTRFNEIYAADTGRTTAQALDDSPLKPLAKISSYPKKRHWRWLRWPLILSLAGVLLYVTLQWLGDSVSSGRAVETAQPTPTQTLEILPLPQVVAPNGSTPTTLPLQTTPLNQNDRLIIQLSRAAVVQVKDATGKDLLSGQQQATQPLQIEGQSPFSITLPEAEAVQQLSLNAEQVSLSPYIVNGRADFRLSR